ncbi:hypothetical protein ACHQM5_006875 [Ranunculus cassubicifolius]
MAKLYLFKIIVLVLTMLSVITNTIPQIHAKDCVERVPGSGCNPPQCHQSCVNRHNGSGAGQCARDNNNVLVCLCVYSC